MSKAEVNQRPYSKTSNSPGPPNAMNIDQWIKALQRSDRLFYNMMALEVWSIAKTMDQLFPGFWSRFMANRREALKQFMQQKTTTEDAPNNDADGNSSN